jgi:hypothetical protein
MEELTKMAYSKNIYKENTTIITANAMNNIENTLESLDLNVSELKDFPRLAFDNTNLDTWKKRFESLCINVMDYGAKGDGLTDDTSAFQLALNVASNIGGRVYAPPTSKGYVIAGQLVIPIGVLLYSSANLPLVDTARGLWTSGQGATLLFTGTSKTPITFEAVLKGAGGSGVAGFIFYYPSQTDTNPPIVYPPAISIPSNTYDFIVENIYLINCYHFFDATSYHGRGLVRNIFGQCFYRGFTLNEMRDTTIYENIHFATIYPSNVNSRVNASCQWMKENFIPWVIDRVDNIMVTNFSVYWCKHGFWFTSVGRAYGQFSNVSIDTPNNTGLLIDGYEPNGLIFSNLMICGCNIGINITAKPRTTGAVQFDSVSMWGVKFPIVFSGDATNPKMIMSNAQIGWIVGTDNAGITFNENAKAEAWLDSVYFYAYAGSLGIPTEVSFKQAEGKTCIVNISNSHFTNGTLNTLVTHPNDSIILQNGLRKISNISIETTQTSIAHGLPFIPSKLIIIPRSNVVVWESKDIDETNVYLTASVPTMIDIWIGQ